MNDLNKYQCIGRLGKDVEVRHTQDNKPIASFSVAMSEKWKDNEKTTWVNVVIFGKLAEVLPQYLVKGTQVYVEGKLQNRSYDDKEGNKRYVTEIVVDGFSGNIQLLGSKGEKNDAPTKPATVTEDAPFDDDIPFR